MQRLIAFAILATFGVALAGCSSSVNSFDPSDMFDFLDTKKKLPGERKPVFPEGVPGLEQGVPRDLYMENVARGLLVGEAAAAAAAAEQQPEAPAPAASTRPRRTPKPARSSSRASRPAPPPPAEQPVAQQPPPPAQRPATPPPAQTQSPFPAPLPSGGFSR
jgi:hypothetical protein